MQFTHAIFDMDGTLVDSMGYWDAVCGELLRELGIYSDDMIETLKPMTVPQTAEYLKTAFGIEGSPKEMISRMCGIMQTHYENDVQPKPGVYDFLDSMQKKGVRMCVASSTPDDLIDICLHRLKMRHYFDFLLSAEEVGKGKTDPDIFLLAANRLNATPQNTMVFEDSMMAADTAKRAGFQTAALYDDTGHTEWDTFRRKADCAFADWHEALRSLNQE